ncbi:MAG: TrmB family transcriptional regulator [Cellulosilyticaceae bacterium]
MNFNEALIKLGFSPIEATVYVTLCKHGPLTGYEVAKFCNSSRSNVYAALYSLQEKGKCYLAEGEATKYIPISKNELIAISKKECDGILAVLENNFPEGIDHSEPYITIRGYENVLNKIKHAILNCSSHLYLLISTEQIPLLQEELSLVSLSKRITILCEAPYDLKHATLCYRSKAPQGFHMIVDTHTVITGDLCGTMSQCLYTTNASLVRMMRESFITELDMIKLSKTTAQP